MSFRLKSLKISEERNIRERGGRREEKRKKKEKKRKKKHQWAYSFNHC